MNRAALVTIDGEPVAEATPHVSIEAAEQGHADISVHGTAALMEALGTSDPDFFDGLLRQLVNAGAKGSEPNQDALDFMLGVIKGVEPRDQTETMLAAQMAATHMATMAFAQRLNNAQTAKQITNAEHALNKLSRTYAAQMETLRRYRQ